MGDTRGFLKIKRSLAGFRPVSERIKDYLEVSLLPSEEHSQKQASRCMDCGTPFCHWACPLGNYIPEWNDFIFKKQWQKAYDLLSSTNNLAEITGRLCPAPCEYACVLEINDEPVTIRENELSIIEYAFKNGYVKPKLPLRRKGKRVVIVGSGPAGLSCADQLNKLGYKVVVFEKDDKPGGLLRYGVPDFKLEKWVLDRRLDILKKEGIEFVCGQEVGKDIKLKKLIKEFDAICLAGGSRIPRDLNIEGRNLKGIYFALDYLKQANMQVSGKKIPSDELIDAKNKKVVILGGGDTGSDCVGVANRQGASKIIQIELLPKPPESRQPHCPWPKYPLLFKTSSSHQEGAERYWQVLTKKFIGENGKVKKLFCVKVEFERDEKGCFKIKEIPNTEFEIDADLVILALGFIRPNTENFLKELDLELDQCGNIKTDGNFLTSHKKIFACGDMRTGQSLIVKAISEGGLCANHIDRYLKVIH